MSSLPAAKLEKREAVKKGRHPCVLITKLEEETGEPTFFSSPSGNPVYDEYLSAIGVTDSWSDSEGIYIRANKRA